MPLRSAVFALSLLPLLPLAWLGWLAGTEDLGVNPIETINRFLGDWALRFLLLALAVTPLLRLTGWRRVAGLRRMVGLFAFFYASLHVTSYVGLDLFLDWRALWLDVVTRTYITLGMAAFLMLIPLAVTSTRGMIRRLGEKRWQALHRLVYPAAILAVAHHWMMVRADYTWPAIHAAILAVLLGLRLAWRMGGAARRAGAA